MIQPCLRHVNHFCDVSVLYPTPPAKPRGLAPTGLECSYVMCEEALREGGDEAGQARFVAVGVLLVNQVGPARLIQ